MNKSKRAGMAVAIGIVASTITVTAPVEAHTTGLHDNCTNFNERFRNGVGTRRAVDQGGDSTNFKRSNRIYWRAERHNGDLDRDNDRIACEQS